MNNDRIEGKWKNVKGKTKEQWGELTDDDVNKADGKWDQLVGTIQNRYGRAKDKVEEEVKAFREQYDEDYERAAAGEDMPLRN